MVEQRLFVTDTRLFAICVSAVVAAIVAGICGLASFVLCGTLYTHRAIARAQAAAPSDVYGYAGAIGLSVAIIVAVLVARPVYRLLAFRDRD